MTLPLLASWPIAALLTAWLVTRMIAVGQRETHPRLQHTAGSLTNRDIVSNHFGSDL